MKIEIILRVDNEDFNRETFYTIHAFEESIPELIELLVKEENERNKD